MRHLLMLLCTLFFLNVHAEAVELRVDSPREYTVQPGDTLWSIANQFLKRPWEWKTLWHANPSIKNPNRLYAGDVIVIDYYQRNPYLKVLPNGTIKLSPFTRRDKPPTGIPAIALVDVEPFLNASLVMDEDFLRQAPYIVALAGENMRAGQGDEVYVSKLHPSRQMPGGTTIPYALYRPGKAYTSPRTGLLLGYKADLMGYGQLVRGGEPATVLLTEITDGVKLRDRVVLNDYPGFDLSFEPKAPACQINASIIDLLGGYTRGAVGMVAVIDQGQDTCLENGDVLGIYSKRRVVNDPMCPDKKIVLPRERVGEAMVFRTFSHTSFVLVMRSIRAVHMRDKVTNP